VQSDYKILNIHYMSKAFKMSI